VEPRRAMGFVILTPVALWLLVGLLALSVIRVFSH
jgi:hypothetical protein